MRNYYDISQNQAERLSTGAWIQPIVVSTVDFVASQRKCSHVIVGKVASDESLALSSSLTGRALKTVAEPITDVLTMAKAVSERGTPVKAPSTILHIPL